MAKNYKYQLSLIDPCDRIVAKNYKYQLSLIDPCDRIVL